MNYRIKEKIFGFLFKYAIITTAKRGEEKSKGVDKADNQKK